MGRELRESVRCRVGRRLAVVVLPACVRACESLSRDDGGKNPGESALIIMGAMATTWWSPRVFLLGLVGIAAIFGGAAEATEVTVVSLEREVDLTSDSLVIASVMNLKNEEAKARVTARLDWTLDASKCMEVTLASPLASKKETTVEIYVVYSLDFVPLPAEIRQSQPQQVGFTNFDVVVSDPGHLRVKRQTTRVFLPSAKVDHYTEVKPSAHKGAEIVYGPYTAPVSGKTVVTIVVQHPDPLLHIEQVTRDITVSSWTDIDVQEHYHIKNVGPPFKDGFSRIEYTRNPQRYIANELSMVLPKQAHSIFFIDVLGNITTSKAKFEFTRVAVDAVPRFPLAPGWQTHFTFGYKVPKQSFVKQDPKTGAKSVVMDILPAVKGIYIKNLTINAAVPEFSTDVTCAPLTTSALFTQADPYREVKAGAHTKKWWFDISGRPVRSLELSDLSSELSHLTFHLKYQFSDILEFKEVFMIAAAWAVVCLIASAWSYSDFTLVRGKAKVKTS